MEQHGRQPVDNDTTDIFGDTVPSPATAKAPESQEHLPVAPEPSPVQPRTMATLQEAADVLSRLSYRDTNLLAESIAGYMSDMDNDRKRSLAWGVANWSNETVAIEDDD